MPLMHIKYASKASFVNMPFTVLQVSSGNKVNEKALRETQTLRAAYAVGRSVLHVYTEFEVDCSIRSVVLRGPEIRKLGRDPGHAHVGVVYGPYAGRLHPLCLYQI